MSETVLVKLKVGKNIDGGIYLPDSVVSVSTETAQAWVEAGDAEYATPSAPKRDLNPKPKDVEK